MSEIGKTLLIVNEHTRSGGETGAAVMRNRCAFTPRDMGADWPEAFTYAVVSGWDDATEELAARWDWDPALVEFLRDAHQRFQELPDREAVR
jgi:hypothetical protein